MKSCDYAKRKLSPTYIPTSILLQSLKRLLNSPYSFSDILTNLNLLNNIQLNAKTICCVIEIVHENLTFGFSTSVTR